MKRTTKIGSLPYRTMLKFAHRDTDNFSNGPNILCSKSSTLNAGAGDEQPVAVTRTVTHAHPGAPPVALLRELALPLATLHSRAPVTLTES